MPFFHNSNPIYTYIENDRQIPSGCPAGIPSGPGHGSPEERRGTRPLLLQPIRGGDEEEKENEMLCIHRDFRGFSSGGDPIVLPHRDAREDAKGEAGGYRHHLQPRLQRPATERADHGEEHQFRALQV